MILHVETTLVKMFGNSVFFADKLDLLPMIFQPILFYPDWFFLTWPGELFFTIFGDGSHPYLHDIGPGAIGWAIVWLIGGVITGMLGVSRTFTNLIEEDRPFIIHFPLVIIAFLLFWHIVLARMFGCCITRFTKFNPGLSTFIRRIVYIFMLGPPILGLTISLMAITMYFFR